MYQKKTSYDFFYLFRDIMRSGSYQKAAKDIGCTVNSLAKKIEQMENDLGVKLFMQKSDGTTPTAAGLFLYDKLDSVLWDLDSVLQQTRSIPSENSLKLNLGISETLPSSAYRQLVHHFVKSYPEIEVTLSAPSWREMHRSLIDGRMDAALVYSIGLFDEPRLARKPLLRSKPCIYYSELMPVDHPEKISINSFRNCTFVCLNTDVAPMNMLKDLPFDPMQVIFADSLKALYLYVNAGLACTVLGPSQQFTESSSIRSFELSEIEYVMGVDLIWEKSSVNPAMNLLINCAEKTMHRCVSDVRNQVP